MYDYRFKCSYDELLAVFAASDYTVKHGLTEAMVSY